jgi:hypothetical protein
VRSSVPASSFRQPKPPWSRSMARARARAGMSNGCSYPNSLTRVPVALSRAPINLGAGGPDPIGLGGIRICHWAGCDFHLGSLFPSAPSLIFVTVPATLSICHLRFLSAAIIARLLASRFIHSFFLAGRHSTFVTPTLVGQCEAPLPVTSGYSHWSSVGRFTVHDRNDAEIDSACDYYLHVDRGGYLPAASTRSRLDSTDPPV